MGWEERNGHRYYYRKERTPDGVRSVYVGAGPLASSIAELCETTEALISVERARVRRTFEPIDGALAALRDEAAALRTLTRAYLVATGHRTHRGQWRRARHLRAHVATLRAESGPLTLDPAAMARRKKAPSPLPSGTSFGTSEGVVVTVPEGLDAKAASALAAAVEACKMEKPKAEDVTRLRKALLRLPASAFQPFADRIALRSAAALLCGDVNTATALAENEAERFAAELAGEGAGPLVRAAASHAATARLILNAVTERYGRVLRGSYSFKEGEHFEKRLSAAQRRYLRALATVAVLRRAEGLEAERAGRLSAEKDAGQTLHLEAKSRAKSFRHFTLPSGDGAPAPSDVELDTA